MFKISLRISMIVLICASVGFIARADAVSDWNTLSHQSSAANVPGRAPTQGIRIAAMTHIAIHNALNSIDLRYEQYAYSDSGDPDASAVAAIAAAAYNVLRFENPTSANTTLLTAYNNMLATVPDGPAKTAGIAIGEASAAAIRLNRSDDGSIAPCSFVPGTGPGEWRPTGPAFLPFSTPCWGDVRPFTMKRGDRWRLPSRPYLDLTHSSYTKEFNEVKEVGSVGSTTRTTDQSESARFWYPNAPFIWGRIAGIVAAQHSLNLWDSARMYAILATTNADTAIVVWDSKRFYPFWRPVTAIREADTDDNPDTEADLEWTSYMVNPPYPDYTSGHSGLDGGSSEILIRFFESDEASFSLATTLAPNPPLTRSFTSFSQAANDGANSRVWGGIHFRSACEDGLWQGRSVGRQVFNHYFRPIDVQSLGNGKSVQRR